MNCKLTEQDRQFILLHYCDSNMSLMDIAIALNVSLSTVKRAVRKIKEKAGGTHTRRPYAKRKSS